MAAGSPQREAKSDNYPSAFKMRDVAPITHTPRYGLERGRTRPQARGQSGIPVNQVVAVAVKILDRFMHGHNRLVCDEMSCRCSQKDNQDAYFKINSACRLPTNSDPGADSVCVCMCVRSDRDSRLAYIGLHAGFLNSTLPSLHATCSLPLCPRALPAKATCCCRYRGCKNFNNPHKLLSKCSTVEGQWSAQSLVFLSCADCASSFQHITRQLLAYYSDFLVAFVSVSMGDFFCCCTECCFAEVVASVLHRPATFGFLLLQSSQQQ